MPLSSYELPGNFCPQFPCFGAIALTFMEKPFIDFNFSLGKLEVMNLGPGDMNVGRLVCDTIKNVMNGLMVFPKKMVVPILPDQDLVVSPLLFVYINQVFRHPK